MHKTLSLTMLASLACIGGFCLTASAQENTNGTFPIADAVVHDLTVKHSYSVTFITSTHSANVLSWVQAPGKRDTFQGNPADTVVTDTQNTVNGTLSMRAHIIEYYAPSDHHALGSFTQFKTQRGLGTGYSVVTNTTALPKAAKIGDSGPYEDLIDYSDPQKTKVRGTRHTQWSLEADPKSPADALFCTTATVKLSTTQDIAQSDKECTHIDTAGNFSKPIEISSTTITRQ